MQATNEDKALEILRLIFSGRLDKENSKAVKQVADIIGRKYSDISTGENTMSHLDQAAALATVDKTPEQREAERQQKLRTEELAGWIVRANAARKRFLLLSKLADGLSTESIERIATAMPHILAEAVNELDGKVEYVMVTK